MLIASVIILAVTAPFGPAMPERPECAHDKHALLALDFQAFDQTEGAGWRPLYTAGCYIEVAQLLREWRARHGENTQPIIPFHEAQMWAYAGHYEMALPLFEQAYRSERTSHAIAWNAYVDGTLAFIRRDLASLEAAVATLEAIPQPDGWDRAVLADGTPANIPWPQNLGVMQGMLHCWEETYEVAFHCGDPDWKRPGGAP
jgi:hypothetical protein